MSGQREVSIRRGGSNVPATDPQARVSTGFAERQAIQTQTDYSGLERLSQNLRSFFGSAGQTIQGIADIEHKEELLQIRRDNEQREIQAASDALEGKEMNPDEAEYFSYYRSYQRTHARSQAQKMMSEWQDKLRGAGPDFDYDGEFEQLRKQYYGDKGTNDPEFNVNFLSSVQQMNAPLRQQFLNRQFAVQASNRQQEFIDATVGMIQRDQGIDEINLTVAMKEAESLTFGDLNAARQLFLKAATTGVVNRGQARSLLIAAGKAGVMERDPELYQALSDRTWKQISETQTQEAYEALDKLNAEAVQVMSNPYSTGEDFAELTTKVIESTNRNGAERGHRAILDQLFHHATQRFKKQAVINVWRNTFRAGLPFTAAEGTLDEEGKVITRDRLMKDFDVGVSQEIQEEAARFGRWQELSKTALPNGVVQPLATRASAVEFAEFVTSKNFVQSTPEPLPGQFKTQITLALSGDNPQEAAKGYYFVKRVHDKMGEAYALRMLGDDTAKRMFQDIQRAVSLRTDLTPEQYLMQRQQRTGEGMSNRDTDDSKLPDFTTLLDERDRLKAIKSVETSLNSAIADRMGLENWFGINNPVHLYGRLREQLMFQVGDAMRAARERGENLSLDKAAAEAVARSADNLIAIPARGDGFMIRPNPYPPGAGRSVGYPVNTLNGVSIYLPGKINDATGTEVDLGAKVRETLGKVSEVFPDFDWAKQKLHLGDPDSGGAPGLFALDSPFGPALLKPGASFRMKVGDKVETVTLPNNVTEARAFLDSKLNRMGIFAVPVGAQGIYGHQALQLTLGAVLEKDKDWATKELARKTQEQAQRAKRPVPVEVQEPLDFDVSGPGRRR